MYDVLINFDFFKYFYIKGYLAQVLPIPVTPVFSLQFYENSHLTPWGVNFILNLSPRFNSRTVTNIFIIYNNIIYDHNYLIIRK